MLIVHLFKSLSLCLKHGHDVAERLRKSGLELLRRDEETRNAKSNVNKSCDKSSEIYSHAASKTKSEKATKET